MDEKKELEALKLGNEWMIRKYLLNKEQGNRVLSIPDYIALHTIKETSNQEEIYVGRTYLKDLSEKMQLSIRQTSNLVGNLKNRGLVAWSHDGNGSDGTYVTITELGEQMLEQQQVFFKQFYGRVIDKFGKENFIQLLNLMKQMETVMSSELEEMEGEVQEDGNDK